jgi:UDP-N-acetylglucosamine--N-acetylmuramyl-(pentapeptide) pyrophosphoryl-undecaprenol N-acetylglucosamine transferase
MRVVVSGGGTAGHILPTLATSDALKSLDSHGALLYIGQAGGMEAKIVAGVGLAFAAISAGKFRRNHFASRIGKILNVSTLGPNARDSLRTIQGVAQAVRILRRFKPDVIFLKGGFVCLPVGIAARLLSIPFVIHESDVIPGLTNRILSRWAARIAVGFPAKSYQTFDPAKLVYVGNPVRHDILTAHRLEGIAHFKLDETLPVILITGGSQGAAQINSVVLGSLSLLLDHYQIIHQTGESAIAQIKFELKRLGKISHIERYHPYGFLMGDMGLALGAADLVIGRAGVNTINDSAVLGKPTILIPNYEMAGHQVENAQVLSRQGAVRVLNGARITPESFVAEIKRVLGDQDEQRRLSEAIMKFSRPNAAEDLAKLVLAVGRAGERMEQKPNTEANE